MLRTRSTIRTCQPHLDLGPLITGELCSAIMPLLELGRTMRLPLRLARSPCGFTVRQLVAKPLFADEVSLVLRMPRGRLVSSMSVAITHDGTVVLGAAHRVTSRSGAQVYLWHTERELGPHGLADGRVITEMRDRLFQTFEDAAGAMIAQGNSDATPATPFDGTTVHSGLLRARLQ